MRIAAIMIGLLLMSRGYAQRPPAYANQDVGYRISEGRIQRTEDGGKVWRVSASAPKNISLIAWDLQSPDRIVAVTAHAIYRASDGGDSWYAAQVLPPGFQPEELTGASLRKEVILCVGSQSGQSVIWRSRDGGIRWTQVVGASGGTKPSAVSPGETYWKSEKARGDSR